MAVSTAPSRLKAGSGRPFIVLGFGLAFLAVIMFVAFGQVLSGGRAAGGQVSIVVAAREIALRTPISSGDLVLKQFAAADVPPHAFHNVDDLTKSGGFIAELNIPKDQPLTENMLARSGDLITGPSPAYLPIAAGYVAVTIPTSEQQGVAGYIQAGDYIAVEASVGLALFGKTGADANKQVVKPVFQNVHVIRIGPATGQVSSAASTSAPQSTQQGGVSSSLTVVMTRCDAEYFIFLLNSAALKYVLQSYHEYGKEPSADPNCPLTTTKGVGPSDIDSRWHFTDLK